MRTAILGELVLAVVLAAVFLAAFGPPWRQVDRGVGWYIAGLTAAVCALVGLLVVAMLGVHVSPVVGVLVLGALDAALALQLFVFLRSRRRRGPRGEE